MNKYGALWFLATTWFCADVAAAAITVNFAQSRSQSPGCADSGALCSVNNDQAGEWRGGCTKTRQETFLCHECHKELAAFSHDKMSCSPPQAISLISLNYAWCQSGGVADLCLIDISVLTSIQHFHVAHLLCGTLIWTWIVLSQNLYCRFALTGNVLVFITSSSSSSSAFLMEDCKQKATTTFHYT